MNNKKSKIALLLIAIIGIVGLTIAYFSNSTDLENTFTTKEYGTTYTDSFVSPDNWLPGMTTEKTLVANNTGEVDEAVRVLVRDAWTTHNNGTLNGWIHTDGTKSTHTTQSELETDERVAILNLANASDWTKVGNYYYYNYKLAPGESTSSFLESVTFNSKTKLDDTCTETVNNGTRTITCNSSGDDYDNATYTLTLTIETVQYNKYATVWGTGNIVNILSEKPDPGAQYLIDNITNPDEKGYNDAGVDRSGLFAFTHGEEPNQTVDYRYIGNSPKNYVKFNCDDDGENCEIWRIIGVFDVDDGTGNIEQRMKLVRGNIILKTGWNYATNSNGGENDWTADNATLKIFLNGAYYNNTGDASTGGYGLKESARDMIGDAVYYLGKTNYGAAEDIYAGERGDILCGSCGSDTSKLTWIGKVALMYPSDEFMVYGKGVNNVCYNDSSNCRTDKSGTPAAGWIFNSNKLATDSSLSPIWFLSPAAGEVFIVNTNGNLNTNSASYNGNGVRPVVYLKSSVEIDSGTGTELDPYVLR